MLSNVNRVFRDRRNSFSVMMDLRAGCWIHCVGDPRIAFILVRTENFQCFRSATEIELLSAFTVDSSTVFISCISTAFSSL